MSSVDAGLSPDAGIDLGKQRRRYLHEAHAAPCDCRCEAGEVPDHAASERHDDIVTLAPRLQDRLDDMLQTFEAFRGLARRHDDSGAVDPG